jgi:predicted DNA-binding protein (MmcQ/YjbR family)
VAHPRMFDPDDPLLARVRAIALALPGADEKESHGRPAFFTKKVFAYYGGATRNDGAWVEHEHAVLFLPVPDERPALEADPRVWVPAYFGPAGWLGLDLDERTDLEEVAELLEDSFRLTAPARLAAALDRNGS